MLGWYTEYLRQLSVLQYMFLKRENNARLNLILPESTTLWKRVYRPKMKSNWIHIQNMEKEYMNMN